MLDKPKVLAEVTERPRFLPWEINIDPHFLSILNLNRKCERLYMDVLKREVGRGVPTNSNSLVEISLKLAQIFAHRNETDKAEQGFRFCIDTQVLQATRAKIILHGDLNIRLVRYSNG